MECEPVMMTSIKRMALFSCFWLGLQSTSGWCEPQAISVLGEQVDGSLLQPEEEPWMLTPAEVVNCHLDGSSATVEREAAALPAIFVAISSGYYEQVPVVVRHYAPQSHRRRSLASRGAHQAAPLAQFTETTVYRSVYRRQARKLDITPMIEKYAQKFNLDPWMLRGVIEVESAFRPHATSCAGAGGLMQLMPGTASYLGCRDRYDPEQNIAAGARYLRQMLNRFDQNYDLAIAAYNAGPGNVERYGGIPPFAETQNYVRKVRKAWSWRP
jgi:soluble lytic murein transglycosylase-like protein